MLRTPKLSTPGSVVSPVISSPFPSHLYGSKPQHSSPNSSKVSGSVDWKSKKSAKPNASVSNKRKRQQQQQNAWHKGSVKKDAKRIRRPVRQVDRHSPNDVAKEKATASTGHVASEAPPPASKSNQEKSKRESRRRKESEYPGDEVDGRSAQQQRQQRRQQVGRRNKHQRHNKQWKTVAEVEPKLSDSPAINPAVGHGVGDGENASGGILTARTTASLSSSSSVQPGTTTGTCPSVSAPSTANATPILRPTNTGALPRPVSPHTLPSDPAIVSVVEIGGSVSRPAAAAVTMPKRRQNQKNTDNEQQVPTTTKAMKTPNNEMVSVKSQQPPRHEKERITHHDTVNAARSQVPPSALQPFATVAQVTRSGVLSGEPASSLTYLDTKAFAPTSGEGSLAFRAAKEKESLPLETKKGPLLATTASSAKRKTIAEDESDVALSRRGLRVSAPAFVPGVLSPLSFTATSPLGRDDATKLQLPRVPIFPPAFIEGASSVASSRQISCVASPVANSIASTGLPPTLPRRPSSATPARTPMTAHTSPNPAAATVTGAGQANCGEEEAFPQTPPIATADALNDESQGARAGEPVFPWLPSMGTDANLCESSSLFPKGLPAFISNPSALQLSISGTGTVATPGAAVPLKEATTAVSVSASLLKSHSPFANTTAASTSATRNDNDNVRHTRLAVPDNLSEDRMYHLLEAGDDDDINGPGVQYYEAAAAVTASRACSAPTLLRVASAQAVAVDPSLCRNLRPSSDGGSPSYAHSSPAGGGSGTLHHSGQQQQLHGSEVAVDDDEEELLLPQGARGSCVLSNSVVAAFVAPFATPTFPVHAGNGEEGNSVLPAGAAANVNDDWETRSAASAVSHHPRHAGNGGGYWGLEGPRASLRLFPPMPTSLSGTMGVDASPVLSPPTAGVYGAEWPTAPQGPGQAGLECLYEQQPRSRQYTFYDADDATAQDYEDVWEVNSSAYEQDSLDEAQAQWIEDQLQASENPAGFFPF